jgi:hypothetical protein
MSNLLGAWRSNESTARSVAGAVKPESQGEGFGSAEKKQRKANNDAY